MFPAYRGFLNRIALNQITKKADIPSPTLGVGEAERLDRMQVTIYKNAHAPAQKVKAIPENMLSFDDVQTANKNLTLADFPNSFYLGETIGG